MFSLNEADRQKIQEAFRSILLKILDISNTIDKVIILDTLYNTVASKHFIDFNIVKDILSISEIEDKLTDPFSKTVFLVAVMGVALSALGKKDEAIKLFDEAIRLNPEYARKLYGSDSAFSSE